MDDVVDHAILTLWALAGSAVPALWAPSLREYRWAQNVPIGAVIACAATYGLCEWRGITGFREVNSIAFFSGVVGVAVTKNVLEVCRSEGFKQWVAARLGIKQEDHRDKNRPRPDSDIKI